MSSCQGFKSSTFIFSIVHRDSCPTSSVGPSISKANREKLPTLVPSHLHLQLSCHICRKFAVKEEFAVNTLCNLGKCPANFGRWPSTDIFFIQSPFHSCQEFIVKIGNVLFLIPNNNNDVIILLMPNNNISVIIMSWFRVSVKWPWCLIEAQDESFAPC